MAVLNVTPDSFFGDSRCRADQVKERIDQLISEGAFVVDIGAESTRPGATPVPTSIQIERLEAGVKYAVSTKRCWVSVDTSEPSVAEAVLGFGAHIINDVSCLRQHRLATLAQRHDAALILMHARGKMSEMAGFSVYPDNGYEDVVVDTIREWELVRAQAVALGMAPHDILFDPGVGFSKNAAQSMTVVRRLREFLALGAPLVLGPSRKSFLNLIEECPPESRLGASVACCLFAAEQGAMMVRVHDVQVVRQALEAKRAFSAIDRAIATEEALCLTA